MLGEQSEPSAMTSSSANPFKGHRFHVVKKHAEDLASSIASSDGKAKDNLKRMSNVASAFWIDSKARIENGTNTVEAVLASAASKVPPELVVLIWYDLPNRDCNAYSSAGEICCTTLPNGTCDYEQSGDCSGGIEEYKRGFVDPIIRQLKKYEIVPTVVVMEPDSIPNMATNFKHPRCGNLATLTAYSEGVKYALNQLTVEAPRVAVYLDAAHGGWLGWEDNLEQFMKIVKEMKLPMKQLRGFATNVANYQPLGFQCPFQPDDGFRNSYCLNHRHQSDPCCADPCRLEGKWNPGNNELNFAQDLVMAARAMFDMDAYVIIDTGRNGISDSGSHCENTCNPRGAGAGVPSTVDVANSTFVDAYFWLKTPGESDGCGGATSRMRGGGVPTCSRPDVRCSHKGSLGARDWEAFAPEAGVWYDFQAKQLAENAHFETPVPLVCVKAYQQCGGRLFNGSTCCKGSCRCQYINQWYSQCMPNAGGWQCVDEPMDSMSDSWNGVLVRDEERAHAPAAASPRAMVKDFGFAIFSGLVVLISLSAVVRTFTRQACGSRRIVEVVRSRGAPQERTIRREAGGFEDYLHLQEKMQALPSSEREM